MKTSVTLVFLLGLVLLASGCAVPQRMWKAADIGNQSEGHVQLRQDDEVVATVETSLVRKLIEVKERIEFVVGVGHAELVLTVSDEPNAFAGRHQAMGIVVGINTGMLQLIGTDWDGYAAIIGHEYAHLALRHAAARAERETLRQGAATVIGIFLGAAGVPMGGTIADLGTIAVSTVYTRDDEREADRQGFEYMSRAGFDPNGAVRTWERMHAAGYGTGLIPFLSTHPMSSERIDNMRALVRARPPSQVTVVVPQLPKSASTQEGFAAAQSGDVPQTQSGIADSGARVSVIGPLRNRPTDKNGLALPEPVPKSPRTPDMLTAVMTSDKSSVAYYLAQGVDINRTGGGSTYLIAAVQAGNIAMVRYLLERGADVNRGDRLGYTPLLHAKVARPPDPKMIQVLVAAGARAEQ